MKKIVNRLVILLAIFIALILGINSNEVMAKNTEDIIISENDTITHTIKEIVEKYKETLPKFNYNESIYKTTPSWENPYSAGSIKDKVITDTINRLNYYRWLTGVDEIKINYDKLDRNQKGAVLSKANESLSHTPEKPIDMDDAFFDEAYDGCNASSEEGDTYSGNCSWGDAYLYESIDGYISDLNNVTIGTYTSYYDWWDTEVIQNKNLFAIAQASHLVADESISYTFLISTAAAPAGKR